MPLGSHTHNPALVPSAFKSGSFLLLTAWAPAEGSLRALETQAPCSQFQFLEPRAAGSCNCRESPSQPPASPGWSVFSLFSGPSIVTPPKEIWNVTGAKIYLSCEVMGIPTPVLTWNKIIRGQYGVQRLELLPGDRDNLAIQTRGGPEKHEVTGWVLISPLSKEDAGEYECHASNSKGEATASARITVVNALHEIPITKGR
uniref:Insulin like growth factor binding protein 7 n=1 Tax=Chelydra serpentina TaxID=8475 RepID=A0A8C3T006_CHESE